MSVITAKNNKSSGGDVQEIRKKGTKNIFIALFAECAHNIQKNKVLQTTQKLGGFIRTIFVDSFILKMYYEDSCVYFYSVMGT